MLAAAQAEPFSRRDDRAPLGLAVRRDDDRRGSTRRSSAARSTGPERCVVLGDIEQAHAIRAKFAQPRDHPRRDRRVPAVRALRARGRERDSDFARYVIERNIHRVDRHPGRLVGPRPRDGPLLQGVRAQGQRPAEHPRGGRLERRVRRAPRARRCSACARSGSRARRSCSSAASTSPAALLLIAAGAPVLAAIALAIKLDSRGPVLFRQTRVGRDGQRFTMFKFRTMFDGADRLRAELAELQRDATACSRSPTTRGSPGSGGFLRRTSLDELPQLINVLPRRDEPRRAAAARRGRGRAASRAGTAAACT